MAKFILQITLNTRTVNPVDLRFCRIQVGGKGEGRGGGQFGTVSIAFRLGGRRRQRVLSGYLII